MHFTKLRVATLIFLDATYLFLGNIFAYASCNCLGRRASSSCSGPEVHIVRWSCWAFETSCRSRISTDTRLVNPPTSARCSSRQSSASASSQQVLFEFAAFVSSCQTCRLRAQPITLHPWRGENRHLRRRCSVLSVRAQS